MRKVLGLIGIVALATSIALGRNSKTNNFELDSPKAAEAGVARMHIVPAEREKHGLNLHYVLETRSFRPSSASVIARGVSEAVTESMPVPCWLSELNLWRQMSGLHAVAENSYLSYASEEHARYLVIQGPTDIAGFRAYDRRIGSEAHLENLHSPSYTVAGAEAAIGGPLAVNTIQGADVAWEGRSESDDIDHLMLAPFHRLSLLAPWARIVGYGAFGEYPRRAAALALRGPFEAVQTDDLIEFPPADAEIWLGALRGSEWPDPIAGCAGYQRPVGVPITLQVGRRVILRSYSLRDQSSEQKLKVCGFDAASYLNSNPMQLRRGRELLNAYGAVVLIPRQPLASGHKYRVVVQTSFGKFEWSFAIKDAATEARKLQAQPPPTGQVVAVDTIGRHIPTDTAKGRGRNTGSRRP
jgi:hypothetical protein